MAEPNILSCKLCCKSKANYTCPRCGVRYCSTECYRSESHLECSELFYRNCVIESLRTMGADSDDRHRMVEMLKNLEEEDASNVESTDVPDLAERISGIDLDQDPERVLEVLSPEELKQLEAFLEGECSEPYKVEVWNPWWCETTPKLLEEMPTKPDASRVPPLLQDIEDIGKLIKVKPSDSIPYDIINFLYGYAYATRFYNGDHLGLSVEFANSLLDISLCLKQVQFSDVSTAINSGISCVNERSHDLYMSSEYSVTVINDVLKILSGPNTLNPLLYIMAALSDCHRVFRNAHKKMKRENMGGSERQKQMQSIYGARKKLEFYLSWVKSRGVFGSLIPLVELEFYSLSTDVAQMTTEKEVAQKLLDEQKAKQNRKLIEEL